MKQSESITKLATALAAVQSKLEPVAKDATNPHFKNKYASLDAIMEAVRPLLAVNGLSIVQGGGGPVSNVEGTVTGVSVETMLVHASGEYLSATITLPLDKGTAQAVGSAISYGRRYGVSALLALSTDDDDGNAASAPRQAARRAESARPAAAASNGAQRGTPQSRPMPIGKSKGKPLGEIDTDDLFGAAEWCSAPEREARYRDLIDDINAVLLDRAEAMAKQ
jgi:hypothetical protein